MCRIPREMGREEERRGREKSAAVMRMNEVGEEERRGIGRETVLGW